MRKPFLVLLSLALAFLAACVEEPTAPTEPGTDPVYAAPRLANVYKLAEDRHVLIVKQGTTALVVRLDDILSQVAVYNAGDLDDDVRVTDLPFLNPCPCCKAGCEDFCVPGRACDQFGMDLGNLDAVCDAM